MHNKYIILPEAKHHSPLGEHHIIEDNTSLQCCKYSIALYGGAMVSTGVVTLGKRVAVAGHALKTANLKINDNNKVALAA